MARAGLPTDRREAIVQEILLAVHLKRHTWDANAPLYSWLFAITRNKRRGAMRRKGRGALSIPTVSPIHRRINRRWGR